MSVKSYSYKLLLVEDNPGDADLARERLADLPDYALDITVATRLSEAVAVLEKTPVDAVILDLNLPDSHGLETLKRVRALRSETAIIVLSGSADETLRRAALALGAQEVLSKTEPASRLVARSFIYAAERHRILESNRQNENIISANPDSVLVVDDNNIVRFANAAALALFGCSAESFVGAPFGYAVRENEVLEIGFEKNGKPHTAEVRAAPFEWQGKRAFLAAIRDITGQKLMAEQLLQSQKLEALGLLAGGVAHDFNNLLTVIVNCATFLSEALGADDPNRHDVVQILGAADRAEALVSQLLALTRRKPIQPYVVDLKEIVQGIESLLRRTLPASITFIFKSSDDVWPIFVDRGRMEQVLMNLAVNAKDAMPDGGTLTMALENRALATATEMRPAGNYVAAIISDTGCGIPPDLISRVFDPFFTTKAVGKGTGLGLATSYAIIQQAGGDISIESGPKGTSVTILLPRAEGPVKDIQAPGEHTPQLRGSETILVVEDDPDVLGTLTSLLVKNGYTVISAGDGEEGLNRARRHRGQIDLVLSDVMMPRMNGHELAKELQAFNPAMKVLLMSGYDEASDKSGDAPDILFKPFRPHELIGRIRRSLNSRIAF